MGNVCGTGEAPTHAHQGTWSCPPYLPPPSAERRVLSALWFSEMKSTVISLVFVMFRFTVLFTDVNLLFVVWYQSYYSGIIRRFGDGVGTLSGGAVDGEQGIEKWAKDTTLWCARIQEENGWCVKSVYKEVQYPQWTANTQIVQYLPATLFSLPCIPFKTHGGLDWSCRGGAEYILYMSWTVSVNCCLYASLDSLWNPHKHRENMYRDNMYRENMYRPHRGQTYDLLDQNAYHSLTVPSP